MPVVKKDLFTALVILATITAGASTAHGQHVDKARPSPTSEVAWVVRQSNGTWESVTELSIEIDRSRQLEDASFPIVYHATRRENGSETIRATDSSECPSIWLALEGLAEFSGPEFYLPDVVRPPGSTSMTAAVHGQVYEVWVDAIVAEQARAMVTLRTTSGGLADWVRETEAALKPCFADSGV